MSQDDVDIDLIISHWTRAIYLHRTRLTLYRRAQLLRILLTFLFFNFGNFKITTGTPLSASYPRTDLLSSFLSQRNLRYISNERLFKRFDTSC